MAQGVSDPSIPGTVMNASGSGVLEVLDSAGNVLIHFETLHAYSHAVLYSDRFTDGETYTVTMGGNSQSVQMTTDSTGGMGFGGGRGGFGGGRRETPEAMPEGGSGSARKGARHGARKRASRRGERVRRRKAVTLQTSGGEMTAGRFCFAPVFPPTGRIDTPPEKAYDRRKTKRIKRRPRRRGRRGWPIFCYISP